MRARLRCTVCVRGRVGIAVVLLVTVTGRRSDAQADSTYDPFWEHSVHVSAAAGVALPTAQFRNNFETAWDGGVTVAWPVVGHRSIRLEGAATYEGQLLTDATVSAYGARGGGASIVSGTVNVVLNAPNLVLGRLTPFVVGGGGAYWRVVELDDYGGTSACSPFIRLLRLLRTARARTNAYPDCTGVGCGGWRAISPQPAPALRRSAVQRHVHATRRHDVCADRRRIGVVTPRAHTWRRAPKPSKPC